MYRIYLYATDPTSEPGKPKAAAVPTDDGYQEAAEALQKSLGALPAATGPEISTSGDGGVLVSGDSPAPQADAVLNAAHAFYLAVRGERKRPILTLTGYVVDQAGVAQISTPVAPAV